MDEEEDDDIYAPADGIADPAQPYNAQKANGLSPEKAGVDLEEGEEEGEEVEESDSDIDIITERKEESKVDVKTEPTHGPRGGVLKTPAAKASSVDRGPQRSPFPVPKFEAPAKATPPRSGASYPAIKSSQVDVDAKPIYEPNGKPITELDMDAEFGVDDKPWRRPGTDITDFFNYGFDEFSWASYCLKQETLRKEVADSNKQMEDMKSFLNMPGIPPMPGIPAAVPGGMPSMGGDLPLEMAQMMQQMMASGMDLSQMTPDMFMQQMMQGQSNGGQGNFGGGQGYGPQGQNQQQMGYGYGGGGSGGGGRGRGQNRRNWQ